MTLPQSIIYSRSQEVGMVSRVEKVGFHKIDLGFVSTSDLLDNLSLCSFLKVLPVP